MSNNIKVKRVVVMAVVALVAAVLSSTGTVMAVEYLPWTANIYSISTSESNQYPGGVRIGPTVSTFDDSGNKCYVINHYNNDYDISCVRVEE